MDSQSEAKQPVPTNAISSGAVSATGSGSGPTTASAANGEGNASFGGGQSGQGNIAGQGNTANTQTGVQPVVIYVQKGGVVNLTASPAVPVSVKAAPNAIVKIRGKKVKAENARKLNKSAQLLRAGKFKEAEIVIGFILLDEPDVPEAHNNKAIALFGQGDYAAAAQEWRKAIALDPSNIDYKDNLSKALAGNGLSVIPADRLINKKASEGLFGIHNQGNKTVFLRWMREFVPGQNAPPPFDSSVPTKTITLDTNAVAMYPVAEGASRPINPVTMPELDFEITYSRELNGPVETTTFHFVPGMGPYGRWRWVPKI